MAKEQTSRLGAIVLGLLAALDLTEAQSATAQEYLDALGLDLRLLEDGEYSSQATSRPDLKIVQ